MKFQFQAALISSTSLVRKRDQVIGEMFSKAAQVVRDTVFCVKYWSKCMHLNTTYKGGLNSLSWLMLVFAFYQQRHPLLLSKGEEERLGGPIVPDVHMGKSMAHFYFWLHKLIASG